MANKYGSSSTPKRTQVAGKGMAKSLHGPSTKSNVSPQGQKSYPSVDARARGAASKSKVPSGGYNMAQGGEGEAKGISAGTSRTRSGKNSISIGQQSIRG